MINAGNLFMSLMHPCRIGFVLDFPWWAVTLLGIHPVPAALIVD